MSYQDVPILSREVEDVPILSREVALVSVYYKESTIQIRVNSYANEIVDCSYKIWVPSTCLFKSWPLLTRVLHRKQKCE